MHTREAGVSSDSISGRRRYISSSGTFYVADTSSRGNASFLRSSESQEFDVVILLSWLRDPTRGCERTGVAGCWWRVLRLPPTLSQVHIPDSRILRAKKVPHPVSNIPLSYDPDVTRRFFRFSHPEGCGKHLALQFYHGFLFLTVIRFVRSIILLFHNVPLFKYWHKM